MKLRIAGLVKESVVDGPGIRYAIFTQGCFHNCLGCHNPETHDPNGGYEIDCDDIVEDIKKCKVLNGITFSGGEPFLQAERLIPIAESVKKMGYNIVAYTGYKFEELTHIDDPNIKRLLEFVDILIDGKFVLPQKDLSLKFRGSRNQRVINIKDSLSSGSPVLVFE